MSNKTLTLPLKRKWWDMITSGVKTEEYRETKQYWYKRLCNTEYPTWVSMPCDFCPFGECQENKQVTFTLGYPRKDDLSRRMTFKIENISIGYGNPEWGAPKDKKVFIIKLGKRL